MAIYHLEAKMVSRGAGRSAVAAAAYLSCSRMLNQYDEVQHDYPRRAAGSGNTVERCGGNRNHKGQPPCL